MTLSMQFLGSFKAEARGEALHVPSKRGRALLAALMLAPDMRLTRQAAAALLWPDRDETQARASLRQELSALKKALGPAADGLLASDTDAISIAPDASLDCDLWSILKDDAIPEEAMALYRGDLLDDVDLALESFEEWLAAQRRVLRARLVTLAERHLRTATTQQDWPAVESCAARLQDLDPFNETAVEALMRAAAANGRRVQAISLFDAFAARLDAELQAKPGVTLEALRAEIAGGAAPVSPRPDEAPASPVPFVDRPAVLVMAVDSLSTSEDDRMLADGLAEELRTTLSYWRWFPVIGPESVGWKTARDIDIREAARTVAASYAVTGSLRRHGDRARITVSLVNTTTGQSIWSQNFDGNLEDVFTFQEDVCRSIVAQVEPQIAHAEAERITRAQPTRLAAWHLVAKADEIDRLGGAGYGTPESNTAQFPLLEEAARLDPGNARAWTRIARIHWRFFIMGWDRDPDTHTRKSSEASRKALAVDPDDWQAHAYQALIRVFADRDYEAAEYHSMEAVRLNPSAVLARQVAGCTTELLGRPREALDHFRVIFRLDPDPGPKAAIMADMSTCHMLLKEYDEAVEIGRRLMASAPGYARGLQRSAASFGHAGRADLAAEAASRLQGLQPDFCEDYVRATYPFRRAEDLDFLIEGLRKAGCLD